MSMDEQGKIYGLIVQAQEMQKYALEFRGTAQEAIKTIPISVRQGMQEAAREVISDKAETAAADLASAAGEARAATDQLRQMLSTARSLHVLWLAVAALVIGAVSYAGFGFLISRQASELEDLQIQAQQMEEVVNKLNSKLGKAEITKCGDRPCIRVDSRPGSYTGKKGQDYMVIYGY